MAARKGTGLGVVAGTTLPPATCTHQGTAVWSEEEGHIEAVLARNIADKQSALQRGAFVLCLLTLEFWEEQDSFIERHVRVALSGFYVKKNKYIQSYLQFLSSLIKALIVS